LLQATDDRHEGTGKKERQRQNHSSFFNNRLAKRPAFPAICFPSGAGFLCAGFLNINYFTNIILKQTLFSAEIKY